MVIYLVRPISSFLEEGNVTFRQLLKSFRRAKSDLPGKDHKQLFRSSVKVIREGELAWVQGPYVKLEMLRTRYLG